MTLVAPTFPLPLTDALQTLRDALGDNYGAATDDTTLTRALAVDAVQVEAVTHARPWATAARLIRWNTEYEVGGKLNARIDRKLQQLDAYQQSMDALAGIAHLLPVPAGSSVGAWPPAGGAVPSDGVY